MLSVNPVGSKGALTSLTAPSPGYRECFQYYNSTPGRRSTASFANALYQSGNPSFNSSGRSSNCDDGELQDMQSDISIEDDVINLNDKVHQLQEQVGILAENQASNDDRYTRVKQENAALTARIHMLEEHIREIEVRGEEKLVEEQRRHKEIVARLDREKHLEIENYAIRNNSLDQENVRLKEENVALRREVERWRAEKESAEDAVAELRREVGREREVRRAAEEEVREVRESWQRDQAHSSTLLQELARELEEQRQMSHSLRQADSGHHSGVQDEDVMSELPARIAVMETTIRNLKNKNNKLEECNEELQAQMLNKGLDEGRKLLDDSAHNNSLAAEFEAMSENEMRRTLKDQQDLNAHLRGYIDSVLINIMDKYPELLEIRAK